MLRIPTNGVPWLVWTGRHVKDMREWYCEGCGQFGCVPAYSNPMRLARALGDINRAHADHKPPSWGAMPPDCPNGECNRAEGQPCGHVGCPLNFGRVEP